MEPVWIFDGWPRYRSKPVRPVIAQSTNRSTGNRPGEGVGVRVAMWVRMSVSGMVE
jgi:hypothetical protein